MSNVASSYIMNFSVADGHQYHASTQDALTAIHRDLNENLERKKKRLRLQMIRRKQQAAKIALRKKQAAKIALSKRRQAAALRKEQKAAKIALEKRQQAAKIALRKKQQAAKIALRKKQQAAKNKAALEKRQQAANDRVRNAKQSLNTLRKMIKKRKIKTQLIFKRKHSQEVDRLNNSYKSKADAAIKKNNAIIKGLTAKHDKAKAVNDKASKELKKTTQDLKKITQTRKDAEMIKQTLDKQLMAQQVQKNLNEAKLAAKAAAVIDVAPFKTGMSVALDQASDTTTAASEGSSLTLTFLLVFAMLGFGALVVVLFRRHLKSKKSSAAQKCHIFESDTAVVPSPSDTCAGNSNLMNAKDDEPLTTKEYFLPITPVDAICREDLYNTDYGDTNDSDYTGLITISSVHSFSIVNIKDSE